ncbi:MAG: mandelate racemase/muconate lactonizing enzyme family protein [Acidobacteriota bacterium]
MKIARIQSFLLSYRFPEPVKLTYYGGERTILKRDAMLVRVEGEKGLVGHGPGQGSEKAHSIIRDIVAPFLEGRTLADPDALRAMFRMGPGADAEIYKIYCMVEVALYDLLGKSLGVPVSELVGGRVRDSITLYASAGMYQPAEGFAREAAAFAELGYRGYKMRPALGPEEDVRAVELMREAVGHSMELMVDAHSWWRMGDRNYSAEIVEQVAKEMGSFDIAWLEEPLPPDDHAAYRKLRDTGYVPVASGEHEPSEDSYIDLIASQAVDFVQMDVVCQGGYTAGQRILSMAQRQDIAFAFHCWGTDLEVMAAAHLGICWPQTVSAWLEQAVYSDERVKSMYEFPLARRILRDPLPISGGELAVPVEPGLGVVVDESVIDQFPWIPGPWSFFTLTSPKETYAVTSDHSVKWNPEEQA